MAWMAELEILQLDMRHVKENRIALTNVTTST
jgi:hypothetical protein